MVCLDRVYHGHGDEFWFLFLISRSRKIARRRALGVQGWRAAGREDLGCVRLGRKMEGARARGRTPHPLQVLHVVPRGGSMSLNFGLLGMSSLPPRFPYQVGRAYSPIRGPGQPADAVMPWPAGTGGRGTQVARRATPLKRGAFAAARVAHGTCDLQPRMCVWLL